MIAGVAVSITSVYGNYFPKSDANESAKKGGEKSMFGN